MKTLVIIPARGGSKGIPKKNIKNFCGKPLIYYSIDIARQLVEDDDICISTDDSEIIDCVKNYGLNVPFIRPSELSNDTATTNDVLLHALDYYSRGLSKKYDTILLLQPTSPLRTIESVKEALNLFRFEYDMVVSVKESHVASVLCEEKQNGRLKMIFNKDLQGRQQFGKFYEYNGAVYVINVDSLMSTKMGQFENVVKFLMAEEESIDIDTLLDWIIAEAIHNNKN